MSLGLEKPFIKQQTVYNGEGKSKPKMSFSTKRVSFDFESTMIQSDSDEENSLGRSNKRLVKTQNDDADELLNMFRSERSDSDDDFLQTEFEVKRTVADKPNPVPRHLRSKSSTIGKRDDDLLQTKSKASSVISENKPLYTFKETINAKAKPSPQPRKKPGYSHSQEGRPSDVKPKVTPRKVLSDGRTAQEQVGMDSLARKTTMKSKHLLSGSDDEDSVDSGRINNKVHKESNKFEQEFSIKKRFGNWKKGSPEEDENDHGDKRYKDIILSSPISKKADEGSYLQEKLNKGQEKLSREDYKIYYDKDAKPYQGKSMLVKKDLNNSEEKDIASKRKYKGMVPAPKPRKHPEHQIHENMTKWEHDHDMEIDYEDTRENIKKFPLPKARKEQLVQEREIVPESISSKSRLHPLDDGDETHKGLADKRVQMQHKDEDDSGDEVDGRTKEKSLDWSSLDESDDDEAVGKKVRLFRPSSAKGADNNNNIGIDKVAKPSPRTRSHRETENMKQKNEPLKKTIIYKDIHSIDYDSHQRVPRERMNKDRASPNIPPRRIVTHQRPGSNKRQNNIGWSREREDEDITDMFEKHIPDTDDFIGGDDNQWLHRKDQLKPQSSMTPKRGPIKADRGIKEMTRSPRLRQTLAHTDNQDWHYPPQQSFGKQKSSSLTNLNRTVDSDFRNYYGENDDGTRRNSLDTETIRQTVYDNWLSRKNVTIKKELSKKALQKHKEEENRKGEEEKIKNAQLAFKSWSESKTETLKEKHAKMKAKQKEEQDKLELEKRMKEKDSKKYFESWKSKKDVKIKDTYKEKKKGVEMEKKKEKEEQLEKAVSSKKCFENWKSKKDGFLKEQFKEKKKKEKLEESKKEDESYEKTIKSADEFQKWVECKGKPRKVPPSPALTQRAWVPGSRHASDCIPTTVQPVILPPSSNRARTMSGTYQGKTKYYDI